MQGYTSLAGHLRTRVIPARKAPLSWRLKNSLRPPYITGYLSNKAARLLSATTGIPSLTAELKARLIKSDGEVIDYGTISHKVVTTAFVSFVVDQLQTETSAFGDFKYHDSGEGNTAENVADTDIETTDGESRATGTQTEGASANIYRSVGTISYTSTKAIVEHGLFNASTSGTLMDRSVFAALNVENGDSIQYTYELTVNAGS